MTQNLRIALAQMNFTVGDIAGNMARVMDAAQKADAQGADLIVFPEMALTGYPPEDLVFKSIFQIAAMDAVKQVAEACKGLHCAILVGGLRSKTGHIYNSSFLIEQGKVLCMQDKRSLPKA